MNNPQPDGPPSPPHRTTPALARLAGPGAVTCLAAALDRAATGRRGMGFHDTRGELDVRLTYSEIRRRARALAGCLLGLGLERGDAVGIVATVQADFVCAFFACQYAGLVAVPLPLLTGMGAARGYEQQLARLFATSHLRCALGPAAFLDHLREASHGLPVQTISTVADLAEKPSALAALQPLGANDVSHIQFSSGSTAFPKGIQISQRALMANLGGIIRDGVGITAEDRVVSWLPFYHDMGLIGNMLTPPVAGIDADFLPTDGFVRRPLVWLELLSHYRLTLSFSPTFGYDLAARRAASRPELHAGRNLDLSSWRVAGLGGDMIQKPVLDRFAQVFASAGFDPNAFLPSYGLAELTLGTTFSPRGHGIVCDRVEQSSIEVPGSEVPAVPETTPNSRCVISCGRVLPGHELEIRDEHNRPLPDRFIGAVFVRGPSLMDGYFQDEALTRETFSRDGWLDTGDMGYLSKDSLFITGRRKDMIIINARNIWPQDIEWIAEQSVPNVRTRDTAAFLHRDEHGDEHVVLLVESRLRDPEELRSLRKDAHAAVLRHLGVDCHVEVVPPKTLTFTTSGKLMRANARQRWLKMKSHGANGHGPQTEPAPNGTKPVSPGNPPSATEVVTLLNARGGTPDAAVL